MFFIHEMERVMQLHPSFFGPNTVNYIKDTLIHDVEGQTISSYYVVCIMDVGASDISEGRVIPGSAMAEYTVHYKAVVWKPFKGEILDGLVEELNEAGFHVNIGPLKVFVSKSMIPSDIRYDGNATPPQWTDNGDQVIETGTHIRIKIRGTRTEMGKMYAIATIKEDYLG